MPGRRLAVAAWLTHQLQSTGPKPGIFPVDMVLNRSAARSPSDMSKRKSCSETVLDRAEGLRADESAAVEPWFDLPTAFGKAFAGPLFVLLARCTAAEVAEALPRALRDRLLAEVGTPPFVMAPPTGALAKTLSRTRCSGLAAPSEGKCPVPPGKGGGSSVPSAIALRFLRYHSAARVWYFCRMGKSSGTPCSLRNSAKRLLPPSSIIRKWMGFQESMLVDCT